jgi:hypothetical protein
MIGVAALAVIASVASPIGTLLWGALLDFVGAPLTIALAAIATIGAVAMLAVRARMTPRPSQ